MRLALAAALALAGCAGARLPPTDGPYRVPGRASIAGSPGAQYRLELAGGQVEYVVDARLAGGDVIVCSRIQNDSGAPVRVELSGATVTDGEGAALALARLDEERGWPVRPGAAAPAGARHGAREIPAGTQDRITRRFSGPGALDRLGRVTFRDEVVVEGAPAVVELALERGR
jgi:hypothetical protein